MWRCGHSWIDVWSIATQVIVLEPGVAGAKLQLAVGREDALGEASDGERGGRSRERGGNGHVCRPIGSWVDAGCRHRRRSRPEVVRDQRVEKSGPFDDAFGETLVI